ncbi:hypothetical protein JCM8202v2_006382 [Rhodotorula sphaerocarpa]
MASESRHLLNPLAPLDEPTPSALDGVPARLERDLRAYGALLIQQAGVMLKAPQVVMATAQVLFQRFWFVTSLKHFGIRDIGMGALFLASKLEEAPVRIRDIINCYAYLSALATFCSSPPYPPPSAFTAYEPSDYFATEFYDQKDALVIAEMQLLKRLGFQTQSGLPYGHLVNYLQVLELAGEGKLVDRCWGYCNDLLQTPAPAQYPQSTLALASIYLATRQHLPRKEEADHPEDDDSAQVGLALPLDPVPWWTHFDADEADLVRLLFGSDSTHAHSHPWPEFEAVNDTVRGGASTSRWTVVEEQRQGNVGVFSGVLDIAALGGAGFASQVARFSAGDEGEEGEPLKLGERGEEGGGLEVVYFPPLPPPQSQSQEGGSTAAASASPRSPRTPTKLVIGLKDRKSQGTRRPDGRRESAVVYQFTVDVAPASDSDSDSPSNADADADADAQEKEEVDADLEKGSGARTRRRTVRARWEDFRPTYRGRPAPDAGPLDPSHIYELLCTLLRGAVRLE